MNELFNILNENIKKHDEIIIMTHSRPDLDGMGSAFALCKLISLMGRKSYIVFPKKMDRSLEKAFKLLGENAIEFDFKKEDEIIKDKHDNSLLIILDTQRKDLMESFRVLDLIKDKIVIDHHISTFDTVDDVIYKFADSNKSSIAEVMAEYLSFLKFNLDPLILTVLFAGMVIDTSNFNIKTTARTFEMAAFLVNSGSDFVLVQEMLKEPKEEMIKRYSYINNSEEIVKDILMCKMDDNVHGNVDIALLAKELLKFEDIKASFAIGRLSDRIVGVSARSMGSINVGLIMKKMGGGGHSTDAATQIKDKTIDEVALELEKIIKDVIK